MSNEPTGTPEGYQLPPDGGPPAETPAPTPPAETPAPTPPAETPAATPPAETPAATEGHVATQPTPKGPATMGPEKLQEKKEGELLDKGPKPAGETAGAETQ